jgi:tetratricopeptide (TPR) repeat protein
LGLNAIDLFDKFSDAASGQLSLGQAIGAANSLIAIDPALGAAFYGVWLSRAPEDQNTAIGWYNVGGLFEQNGLVEKAAMAYRKAARMVPSIPEFSYDLLRQLMLDRKPKNDEAIALCRHILGGGLYRRRHERAEIERLDYIYFGTVALYAGLQEALGQANRAEYFYETYIAQGGENASLSAKLAGMKAARHGRRRWSGFAERRLEQVDIEIVAGRHPALSAIDPEALSRRLSHIDVDVISVLRLGRQGGDPLLHPRLLGVMSAFESWRAGPVRVDRLEIWTDGKDLDLVQLEEAMRSCCIDALVVRCGADAERDSLHYFLETVASFRRLYDLDMALTARLSDAFWAEPASRLGWAVEVAGPDAPEREADLAIAIDGTVAGLGDLQAERYTRFLAGSAGAAV